MRHMDERQETFAGFEVPDPGRIRKVPSFLLYLKKLTTVDGLAVSESFRG